MLAVFSLREVELSRRIQCYPTLRKRFYSILLLAFSSSSRYLQFPATHSFFIGYFFAPHSRVHPSNIYARASRAREFSVRKLRRACFCKSVRSGKSTRGIHSPTSEWTKRKRSSFLLQRVYAMRAAARNSTGHLPKGVRDDWVDRIYSFYAGRHSAKLPLSKSRMFPCPL